MSFKFCSDDRQNHLFEEGSQDEILIIAFEQSTNFSQKCKNLMIDSSLNQSTEYIAKMFFIKLLKEIFSYVYKVFDVLYLKSKSIKE